MKNYIVLLCFHLFCGLVSCSEKKSVEEKKTEQTAPPVAEVLDDGVVIGKQLQEDTLKGSLKAYAKGKVGDAEIKIKYHAPAVRGRIVWGGLVPFDKVWVTGAHMATTFEINKDFEMGGKNIPAGKYAIFTIPGKETWTFILNKNWQQHLTDEYDAKDDVVRVVVQPETGEPQQERLRYSIEGERESEIVMYWEKIELSLPIKIK